MSLSDYERRVLAELEADLGELKPVAAARHRRWRAVGSVLRRTAPTMLIGSALAVVAVATSTPVAALVMTGLIGAVTGCVVTMSLTSYHPRWWRSGRRRGT